ncbi:YdeI/OmpD-associated family protein [Cohnella rhizosphaerae]|uniref:YdeI family protein n=1 Tax=Cohnella rhizosphaerae TaxID=1457232 RepID=A0A9X4L2Z3_9BACL|nr:YdeI family protein [Cohnella rhizosphaerae]MDG0812679.1 YdeI family protein [Cohnella rhizosphaerae]
MINRQTHPKADAFFEKSKRWKAEYEQLREIVMDCGLTEDFKWMHPCYTYQSKNVLLIHGFKEYCALLFHKGVLLKDPNGILIQQTENVQAGRQLRFTSVDEIVEQEAIVKAYVRDAINVEKSGLEVTFKKNAEYPVAEELQRAFDENPDLKAAFESLTPGRQRGYLLHFSQPKQSKTREARIEKYKQKMLEGKGLDD